MTNNIIQYEYSNLFPSLLYSLKNATDITVANTSINMQYAAEQSNSYEFTVTPPKTMSDIDIPNHP